MDYQTRVIEMTESACDFLFRAAYAVPHERLAWKPFDLGRSVLNQLQECAIVPLSFAAMLNARSEFYGIEHQPAEFERANAEFPDLTSVKLCQQACQRNTHVLCEIIYAFPQSHLKDKVEFNNTPFPVSNCADLMMLHTWNCVYHAGQINYVQTLYGDFQIH